MTWSRFVDGSKRVTRRSRRAEGMREGRRYYAWAPGWPTLKPGDVVEGIEWLPRWEPHGERWVCRDCGWLGDTDPGMSIAARDPRWAAHAKARPDCHHDSDRELFPNPDLIWRPPERLPGTEGHRRIVSVRDELLGDITPEDVVLEGFPGQSTEWFAAMYCSGDPDWDRPVNRIEFEELS